MPSPTSDSILASAWSHHCPALRFALGDARVPICAASVVLPGEGNGMGALAGFLFDVTGSYLSPYLTLSALSLLAVVLILLVRKPKPRSREAGGR